MKSPLKENATEIQSSWEQLGHRPSIMGKARREDHGGLGATDWQLAVEDPPFADIHVGIGIVLN
jgi:hypothetical protein